MLHFALTCIVLLASLPSENIFVFVYGLVISSATVCLSAVWALRSRLQIIDYLYFTDPREHTRHDAPTTLCK